MGPRTGSVAAARGEAQATAADYETAKLSLQAELAIGDRVAIIHLHRAGKDRRREAILQKRESLHRLIAKKYSPDVSVFTDGKVEIMFKLTYEQAENLARLMKGQDL